MRPNHMTTDSRRLGKPPACSRAVLQRREVEFVLPESCEPPGGAVVAGMRACGTANCARTRSACVPQRHACKGKGTAVSSAQATVHAQKSHAFLSAAIGMKEMRKVWAW